MKLAGQIFKNMLLFSLSGNREELIPASICIAISFKSILEQHSFMWVEFIPIKNSASRNARCILRQFKISFIIIIKDTIRYF